MDEIWKDIPGYEGYYEVSSMGNVRGKDRIVWHKSSQRCKGYYYVIKAKPIKYEYTKTGYKQVVLCKECKTTMHRIHMLVAMAFLGYKKYSGLVINHLNGQKTDNRVDNLEITTVLGNTRHAINTGLIKTKFNSVKSKVSEEDGYKMVYLRTHGYNISQIAKMFHVRRSAVHRVLMWIAPELIGTSKHPNYSTRIGANASRATAVIQYKEGKFIKQYPYIGLAAKETGISPSSISVCLSGRTKTAGGYVWKYVNK